MALYFDGQKTLGSEQYDAVAYYRLSKDDGAKHESDSIANQRKVIRAFLQNNPNIHLVEEAQDDGYTGTNFDRPGFRSVLHAIQSKRVNCVIVKDLSRLGREYIETGKYLEMIFPSFGVRFIAINDDVDSENSRAGDDIIIPVKNIMNEVPPACLTARKPPSRPSMTARLYPAMWWSFVTKAPRAAPVCVRC